MITGNDCLWSFFDESSSTCYAGLFEYSSGSWSLTGTKEVIFNTERLQTFVAGFYTITATVPPLIYEKSGYKVLTSSSAFSNDDCAAYCHLDNVQPCLAYSVVAEKCYLMDLATTGEVTLSADNTIRFNTGIKPFLIHIQR